MLKPGGSLILLRMLLAVESFVIAALTAPGFSLPDEQEARMVMMYKENDQSRKLNFDENMKKLLLMIRKIVRIMIERHAHT